MTRGGIDTVAQAAFNSDPEVARVRAEAPARREAQRALLNAEMAGPNPPTQSEYNYWLNMRP